MAQPRSWLSVLLLVLLANAAQARPPHKKAMVDYYGPFLPARLHDCKTCHLPGSADVTSAEERPHNDFGQSIRQARKELLAKSAKADVPGRLDRAADQDSDGDGVTNLLELLSGHFPGDATDVPTAEELKEAQGKIAALQEFLRRPRWTPFEQVVGPAVPSFDSAWVKNPIDAFVMQGHEQAGLHPHQEAPKARLLRRVYLDLIGLPPSPEEQRAFLEDPSPNAYEKVVEDLLRRPQHGERWARHWMDVWRYSDWAGFGPEVRDSQPFVWRWRDWIVDSLNADKGYDRMVTEMLAGDEVAPEDENVLRATGFLVRNYKRFSRERWLQDAVDHTFMAFQGVTLGCARCHDHVYDPILQREYFQVRAIFAPHNQRIDRRPGQLDVKVDGLARAFDAEPKAQTFLLIRGDDRQPDKMPLDPGVPESLGSQGFKPEPVPLPSSAIAPDARAFVREDLRRNATTEVEAAKKELATARTNQVRDGVLFWSAQGEAISVAALGQVEQTAHALKAAELNLAIAETRQFATLNELRVERLEDEKRQDSEEWKLAAMAANEAQRKSGYLSEQRNTLQLRHDAKSAPPNKRPDANKMRQAEIALGKAEEALRQPPSTQLTRRTITKYPDQSTGRRLALAKWLVNEKNPLTARVAMNHLWLRHLGEGIVPSVFDFGSNGRPPSHPQLLDWLASEFMAKEWSMKAMHRLIVTSNTYKQDSTPDAAMLAKDPDNRLLWRMSPRRLEAEAVRDSLLYVAGRLDLLRGGPDLDHQAGLATPRRSLYFRHAAEKQMEFLKLFDTAATSECYQRKESILPQQALALANSEISIQSAKHLAKKLNETAQENGQRFVDLAFSHVLARTPTDQEKQECVAYLNDAMRRSKDGDANAVRLRARESLIKVLLNHHEFVTLQ